MPAKLIDIVRREAADHLKAYFAPGAYTGQWFETFAGGGDRAETRDRITLDDLYAVEALNVQVPFAVGREILDGKLGRDISAHLREIPPDTELGTDGASDLVADRGPAEQAWLLLNDRNTATGIGWVIAGKLLARKRPKLIPVYDSIVSCQFGAPGHVWLKLHNQLALNNEELRAALGKARATIGVNDQTSILRALDVVLWRRHHENHTRGTPKACPQHGSVAL